MTTMTRDRHLVYESAQIVHGSPMRRLADNKLVDKPARCLIPNHDRAYLIVDGKKKLTEISYIKGANTHITSEQRAQGLIQKDERNQEIFPDIIEVINGIILMDAADECGRKYLEDSSWNGSNHNRRNTADILFYVRDTELEASKSLTLRKLKLKAEHAVMFELTDKEIIDLVGKVRDRNNRPLNPNRSAEELRVDLAEIAKFNPDAILNGTQDNDRESKTLVMDAIDAGVIKAAQGGIWKWAEGEKKDERVCTMKAGMTQVGRVEVLNAYLTSQEGESDLALLKTLLENKLATV